MRMEKLILHKCNRLALGLETLTYTPTSDIQIIVGTNGSGKTTLLMEANSLPSNQEDFSVGGFKYIEITHNGKLYIAESKWVNSNFKHFLTEYDGDKVTVLNNGGTATAQRDITKEIFGITPDIRDLLIGTDNAQFTKMSTAERKMWLTKFSKSDLTFATKLFGAFKSLGRDAGAALKHVNSRISVETAKLLEMGDVERFEEETKRIREELNSLMLNKEQGLPKKWDVEASLRETMAKIERMSREIIVMDLVRPDMMELPTPHTVTQVDDYMSTIKNKININENILEHYACEYVNIERTLHTLEDAGVNGISELEDKLKEIEQTLAQYRSKIQSFKFEDVNVDELKQDTAAVGDLLQTIMSQMPDNTEKRYNQQAFRETNVSADNARLEITRRRNAVTQFETRLEHLKHTESTECPQCRFKWVIGVRPGEALELKAQIDKANDEILVYEETLKTSAEFLDECNNYMSFIGRYRNLVSTYPRLRLLWNAFSEDNIYCMYPMRALTIFNVWQTDVNSYGVISSLEKEKTLLTDVINQSELNADYACGSVSQRGKELTEKIGTITDTIESLRKRYSEVSGYHRNFEKLIFLKSDLLSSLETLRQLRDSLIKVTKDGLIESTINKHHNTLASAQHVINQKKTLQDILTDHNNSAAVLAVEKESYDILTNAISPTSGFIAEQLMGVINSLVEQFNIILAGVWSYGMTVEVCGFEKGELNYKFPVDIEGSEKIRSDVCKTSKAQAQMINIAFRIIAYTHLGLDGFPLYLDEAGEGFDETHRENLLRYILDLVGAKMFSQVFMISHYASSYGSFMNAEIAVLNPSNITVPEGSNANLELVYAA